MRAPGLGWGLLLVRGIIVCIWSSEGRFMMLHGRQQEVSCSKVFLMKGHQSHWLEIYNSLMNNIVRNIGVHICLCIV